MLLKECLIGTKKEKCKNTDWLLFNGNPSLYQIQDTNAGD